jgi:hypothetical protein
MTDEQETELRAAIEAHLARFGEIPWDVHGNPDAAPLLRMAVKRGSPLTETEMGLPPGAVA